MCTNYTTHICSTSMQYKHQLSVFVVSDVRCIQFPNTLWLYHSVLYAVWCLSLGNNYFYLICVENEPDWSIERFMQEKQFSCLVLLYELFRSSTLIVRGLFSIYWHWLIRNTTEIRMLTFEAVWRYVRTLCNSRSNSHVPHIRTHTRQLWLCLWTTTRKSRAYDSPERSAESGSGKQNFRFALSVFYWKLKAKECQRSPRGKWSKGAGDTFHS